MTALSTRDMIRQAFPPEEPDAEQEKPVSDTGRMIRQLLPEISFDSTDKLAGWELANRLMQIEEMRQHPDRSVLGEIAATVPRAAANVASMRAGLLQMVGRTAGRFGESLLTEGQREEALAAFVRANFPRSDEEGISLRRTVGDVVEASPSLLMAALLTAAAPESIPAQLVIFAGTTGAMAAGQQYLQTMQETDDHGKALAEAAAAGLLETFVERFTFGQALAARLPRSLLRNSAMRVGIRMALGAGTESLEELAVAVGQETVASLVRQEPERLKEMLAGDPEFWSGAVRQMLAGAGAGGIAAGGFSIVESVQVSRLRRKLAAGEKLVAEDVDVLRESVRQAPKPQKQDGPAVPVAPAVDPTTPTPAAGEAEPTAEKAEVAEAPPAEPSAEVVDEAAPKGPSLEARLRSILQQMRRVGKREVTAAAEAAKTAGPSPGTKRRIVAEAKAELAEEARALTAEGIGLVRQELRKSFQEVVRRTKSVEQARSDLVRDIRAAFKGGQVPKRLLTAVEKAKTLGTFARAYRLASRALAEQHRRAATREALKAIKRVSKRAGFTTRLRSVLNSILAEMERGSPQGAANLRSRLAEVMVAPADVEPQLFHNQIAKALKAKVPGLTADDAISLAQALQSVADQQRHFEQARGEVFQSTVEGLADQIAAEIEQSLKALPVSAVTGRETFVERGEIRRIIVGLAENSNPSGLAELMGGDRDSMAWKVIFRMREEAQDRALAGFREDYEYETEVLREAGIPEGSRGLLETSAMLAHHRGIAAAVLRIVAPQLEERFFGETAAKLVKVKLASGESITATPAQWADVLASLEDPSTFDLIARGAPATFRGMPHGRRFSIGVEDLPAIREAAGDLADVATKFVDRASSTVTERLRRFNMNERGIDPITGDRYWPRLRQIGVKERSVTEENFIETVPQQAGMAHFRAHDETSPIVFMDIFERYRNMSWTSAMLAEMAGPMRLERAVMKHDTVLAALRSRRLRRAEKQFDTLRNRIAAQFVSAPSQRGAFEEAWYGIVTKVGRGLLGLRFAAIAGQAISVSYYAEYVPLQYVLAAIPSMADPRVDKRMFEISPAVWFRNTQSAYGLIFEGGSGGQIRILGSKKGSDNVLAGYSAMDHAAVRGGFVAVERWAAALERAGRLPKGMTREQFIKSKFEEATYETQPNFDPLHMSFPALEAQGKALKAFLMFRAERGVQNAMMLRHFMAYRANPTARNLQRLSRAFFVRVVAGSILWTAMKDFVGWMLRGFQPDEEDDDLATFLLRSAQAAAGIPLLGELLYALFVMAPAKLMGKDVHVFEPDLTPLEGIVERFGQAGISTWRGMIDRDTAKALEGAMELAAQAGPFIGLPTPALYDYLKAALREEEPERRQTPRRSH